MADQQRFNFSNSFNSSTLRGRANVSKITLAGLCVGYAALKMQQNWAKRREATLYCKQCRKSLKSDKNQ